jgi:hypothetical protein
VPAHSDAEIDAAIEALSDPGRLDEAQRLVAAKAPQLQGILDQAMAAADWFGAAHEAEVLKAAGRPDPDERVAAVRTLVAEETRVSMLVGVAVGYELAQMLTKGDSCWQSMSSSSGTHASSCGRATPRCSWIRS